MSPVHLIDILITRVDTSTNKYINIALIYIANICMEGVLVSSSLRMHYVVLSLWVLLVCLLNLLYTTFYMLGFWLVINMLGIWQVQNSCIQLFLQGYIGSLFSTDVCKYIYHSQRTGVFFILYLWRDFLGYILSLVVD